MSDEISTRHLTKFNGSNFQAWKFQMKAIFIAYGLDDIVSGSRVIPQEAETVEGKKWVKDNAKAMFLVSSAMDYTQLESLLTCTTVKEMWDKLGSIHEQKSATNKLIMLQKFHEYRMKPNESVVQHVARVQNMATQLKDVGENVSNTAVIAKVLGSLPPKYNALQTAWDSVDEEKQTTDNLLERLIKEETRQKADDDATSALAVMSNGGNHKHVGTSVTKNNGKSQENKKSNVNCFYCNKRGHYARECRQKQRDKKSRDKESESGNCVFVATIPARRAQQPQCIESTVPSSEDVKRLLAVDIEDVWISDSGASRHITHRREWYSEFHPSQGESVSLGDNGICEAYGKGTITVNRLVNGEWREARIENVLYVPKIRKNLFSVGMCTSKGFEVKYKGPNVIHSRNEKVVAVGVKQDNGVYRMFFTPVIRTRINDEVNITTSLRVWHERMGHVNNRVLREMSNTGLIRGVKLSDENEFFCESCPLGKSHKLAFKKNEPRRNVKPGEMVHTDVCGPMSVESTGGARFFVTFKDEASGFRFVYFIKHKSDVVNRFKEYETMTANKFGRRMKTIRADNGREYCNQEMKEYLTKRGIRMENTAPYTPQQNGKSERDNRTIVESARTMIHAKDLPLSLWAEAVNTAVYVLNRTLSSKGNGKTPYEAWMGKTPTLSHLRIFGSDAYVLVDKQFRRKFDSKAEKTILVGYQGDSSNYRLYNPETKRITVARDVTFNEETHKQTSEEEEKLKNLTFPVNTREDEGDVEAADQEQAGQTVRDEIDRIDRAQPNEQPRQLRDRRLIRTPARYDVNIAVYNPPVTFQEATNGSDAEKWIEAIEDELAAHKKNETWSIVRRNPDQRPIDSKWVFKVLQDTSGTGHRYKARLCARGFLQKPGLDYTETFSPVVRYDSLRVLLAIVAEEDLELTQFDVRTAFLYGELQEEIHMEVPEGLVVEEERKEVVCKLKKSLYGLKQAPRCWNEKFRAFLNRFSFQESEADKCMFRGHIKRNRCVSSTVR